MMSFGALKYFGSVIKKVKKIIVLYQPRDLQVWKMYFSFILKCTQNINHKLGTCEWSISLSTTPKLYLVWSFYQIQERCSDKQIDHELMFFILSHFISLCITQCLDNKERRCAEFVKELLDLRDGLLHVDILSQNEVLELIQLACTLWS